MKTLLSIVIICGTEMWETKVARDPQAVQTLSGPVLQLSVAEIGSLEPGVPWIIETRAHVKAVKRETDEDLHIILEADGSTMVAEIPSVSCSKGSIVAKETAAARAAMRHIRAGDLVRVKGFLFFDRCDAGHKPSGAAPNCAEIHPVIEIAL